MAYRILIEPGAQLDIENAYKYYLEHTTNAIAELFYNDLQDTYSALAINPFISSEQKIIEQFHLKNFHF